MSEKNALADKAKQKEANKAYWGFVRDARTPVTKLGDKAVGAKPTAKEKP